MCVLCEESESVLCGCVGVLAGSKPVTIHVLNGAMYSFSE